MKCLLVFDTEINLFCWSTCCTINICVYVTQMYGDTLRNLKLSLIICILQIKWVSHDYTSSVVKGHFEISTSTCCCLTVMLLYDVGMNRYYV